MVTSVINNSKVSEILPAIDLRFDKLISDGAIFLHFNLIEDTDGSLKIELNSLLSIILKRGP